MTIYLHAPNVGGLKPRAGVLMSGVQVGTVSDIKLAPRRQERDHYAQHRRSATRSTATREFVIEQSGFLGDQYVAIMPRREQRRTVCRMAMTPTPDAPFDLQEVARSAAGFIERIDETAAAI